MLAATKRHPYRPAHVHFMIAKEGFEGLTTHIFSSESPYLDADTVFGVKESLIADLTHEEPGIAPDGSQVDEEWRKLVYDFMLKPTNSAAKPNSLSPVKDRKSVVKGKRVTVRVDLGGGRLIKKKKTTKMKKTPN